MKGSVILLACAGLSMHAAIAADVREYPSVSDLQHAMATGESAEVIARHYLARIRRLNPRLHAVLAINPQALEEARLSDARRLNGTLRGPLDGVPVLVKDNVDVAGMPTTGGSLALLDNRPQRDAWLIASIRRAGLVILGKTNLSEWANFRSAHSISGWSAVGGLVRNPYVLDRSACGSSSGSAVAVAVGFAPLAIGTETDGSITCPAAVSGIVGIKPTVGLVSRSGIIPISASQDTAGPLARNVADATLLLQAMSGADPADSVTAAADSHRMADLDPSTVDVLRGARIGVVRFVKGFSPSTLAVFDRALATLRAAGVVLVDVDDFDFGDLGAEERTILLTEFKAGLDSYLQRSPPAVKTRSLEDVIAFNRAEPRELKWFGQDLFEHAATTSLTQADYRSAHLDAPRRAGADGLDRLLHEYQVAALVSPTTGPAWMVDFVNGDSAAPSSGKLSAVAGYPHVTVPMGSVAGLPLGLSFLGAAFSEAQLLALAMAFEKATPGHRAPQLLRHVP